MLIIKTQNKNTSWIIMDVRHVVLRTRCLEQWASQLEHQNILQHTQQRSEGHEKDSLTNVAKVRSILFRRL